MSGNPVLIVLAGFAGVGKTTLSKRLSADLRIPCLGSDNLARIIGASQALEDTSASPYWIAYDVFFGLAEEFLRTGVSVILDSNMGEAWRWQRLDALRERTPGILFLPIVLRCPLETCVERMRKRHADDPENEPTAEAIMAEPRHVRKWEFVEQLGRPDVHCVDAARPEDEVFEDIKQYVSGAMRATA